MAQNDLLLKGLQGVVTNLAQQGDGHAIQTRVFAGGEFLMLAFKYAEHATEEHGFESAIVYFQNPSSNISASAQLPNF